MTVLGYSNLIYFRLCKTMAARIWSCEYTNNQRWKWFLLRDSNRRPPSDFWRYASPCEQLIFVKNWLPQAQTIIVTSYLPASCTRPRRSRRSWNIIIQDDFLSIVVFLCKTGKSFFRFWLLELTFVERTWWRWLDAEIESFRKEKQQKLCPL